MMDVRIDGMTCGHCVSAVKKAVLKLDPGATVEVDLAAGTARVDGQAPASEVISAIEAEGYKASITGGDQA